MSRTIQMISLVLAIVVVSALIFRTDKETSDSSDSTHYTADSLGNLQETSAPEPVPVAVNVTPTIPRDSVYKWDDVYYDFIPSRLFDPNTDQPTQETGKAQSSKPAPPEVLNWETLTNIEYRMEYFPEMEMDLYSPIFPDHLKALDGQMIEINGYVIPMEETGKEVALSANPYASCFFCGQASPASVMSIFLTKANKRLRIDDKRTFRGRLRLNYDDPNQFYYILEDAVIIRS